MTHAPPIAVFLAPGDYFVGDARHCVRTLLGSCVSITLWQPERRIGAMSHFLLSERMRLHGAGTDALDGRYGNEALALMLHGLAKFGVTAAQCEAKLFGGGDMFPGQALGAAPAVGRRNGNAAHQLLADHGIKLVSHSLFGVGHRKILFDIATGDVWSRQAQVVTEPAPLSATAPADLPPASSAVALRTHRRV